MIKESPEQLQSAIDACVYLCVSQMGMGKNKNVEASVVEYTSGHIKVSLLFDIGRTGYVYYDIDPDKCVDETEIARDTRCFNVNRDISTMQEMLTKCWGVMEDISLLPDVKEIQL